MAGKRNVQRSRFGSHYVYEKTLRLSSLYQHSHSSRIRWIDMIGICHSASLVRITRIMAKAEQIIELLMSHVAGDDHRFFAIAMQVAAHEAQQGHEKLAQELKALIDKAKEKQSVITNKTSVTNLIQPKGDLANLLSAEYTDITFARLTFRPLSQDDSSASFVSNCSTRRSLGTDLNPEGKFFSMALPATGKTITASALAGELHLPLFTDSAGRSHYQIHGRNRHQTPLDL